MANIYMTGNTVYSSRQRAISLTLGVACSIPLTSTMAMANAPMPPSMPMVHPGAWQTHLAGASSLHGAAQNSFSGGPSSFAGNSTTAVHSAVASLTHLDSLGLQSPAATGGVINLASSKLSFLAGNLANFQNMTIDVGGHQEIVSLNTKLTGAEVVAAEQVLSGAGQTIKLSASGVADGGSVSLNSSLLTALDNSVGGSISSLTIAKGVQVVDSLNVLSLSGGLSNYGSILTAASSGGSSDTISAGTILNAAGGAIGSYSGGGSGAGALVGADPILSALTSITNNGSITSAGNLTISAPVVYNVASQGSTASISAANNVNINTSNLTNSGTIAAVAGNVNLAAMAGNVALANAGNAVLTLNGTGGTLQANNGNINLSSSSTDTDIDVEGGNMLSQQVNFDAGTGNVTANLDQVTGVVNATGNNVHIGGNTATLDLGTINASGDPVFTNTGNFDITSTINVASGAPLTIIAGGNIISTGPTPFNLDISSTTGNGGALSLIAGATYSQPGAANTPVTVTKASASGGIIDLTGLNNDGSGSTAAITTINTSSTAAAGASDNGGNVQLVAYAGKTAGSGSVFTDTSGSINASSTNGTAGAVSIIAGAKTGTVVTTGSITGSTVTVDTATPTIVPTQGVTGVVFGSNGAQADGTFTGAAAANVASATLGNVSGTFNANSGGVVTVVNTSTPLTLGTVAVGKTGSLVASSSGSGAGGTITVTGIISGASASLTTTATGEIITTTGTGSINTSTLNLTASTGTEAVTTDVSNLVLNNTGSNNTVYVTQGTATMGVSGNVGSNSLLTIVTSGQVNINGPLYIQNGSLNVATTTTDKGGISVGAKIFTGTTGYVDLANNGTGLLTETAGNVLTAQNITLISGTNIGSKAAPFLTNSSYLTVNDSGAKSVAYVSDQNTAALTFEGNTTGLTGGSLFLTSLSSNLVIEAVNPSLNYNNISITDTAVGAAAVLFDNISGYHLPDIGTGAGTVTVVTSGGITYGGGGGAVVLSGTTVTLSASGLNANIGSSGTLVSVNSANLSLTSSQGSVYVTDSTAATVNGSASLTGIFSVTDNGAASAKTGDSLTVGKSVGGGTIDLTTTVPGTGSAGSIAVTGTVGTSTTNVVDINSVNAVTTKGKILGQTIGIGGASVTIGGAVGNSTSNLTFDSISASGLTISGALSGNQISVTSAGTITTKAAINASGANSAVTLDGSSTTATGNAVVVGAVITGSNINLGLSANGQGNIALNAAVGNTATTTTTISAAAAGTGVGGSITGTGLVSGTNVTLTAATSIGASTKPVQTAAGTLSANAFGTATGTGAFITQKGNLALGSSNDTNLVVKVTGALDVTGTVVAPNLNLTSTGGTTIDGTIQNTAGAAATTGTMVITSGGAFTLSPTGSITTTAGSNPITINVTGLTSINGTIMVQTLNLTSKGGVNVGTTGGLLDGADNITASGPIVVDGTIGSLTAQADFTITTTGSFTFGPNITINGVGSVKAASISNYATLNADGALTLVATGTGNAFANYGTIDGLDITLTTTSAGGVIYNAAGATIVASSQALQTGAPTINLNTYGVNNQGNIQAIGLVEQYQGALNITSPGALTISGANGSFAMNYFSAVTLKAGGNIIVGGVVSGQTVNPFSNFTAANELGDFTVNTTGTFSTPITSISVMTNTTGSFGGSISITASNVLYNGVGTTSQPFTLSATGAGPTISVGTAPITLDLTGSQGITIGSNPGNFSISAEGYGGAALTTISTPGALVVNTAELNVNYTSLALTGNARVLITGNLDEGTNANTAVTITTNNSSAFLIGGATSTGNGQNGITNTQGISAGVLTINAPGVVTIGTASATNPIEAVLTGATSVTLNSQSLTVNTNSDVVGLSLTLNNNGGTTTSTTSASGVITTTTNTAPVNTNYTNLNQYGFLSASAIIINDPNGTVTLSNGTTGGGSTTIGVGTNPNGPAESGVQLGGGTISISAQSLSFAGSLVLNATGGIDGGKVTLNLTGSPTSVTPATVTIGTASGQISVNVAGTSGAFQPEGTGYFSLNNNGNIVVLGLNGGNQSNSTINLGPVFGNLILNAYGSGPTGTGATVSVSGANGLSVNLFQLSSSSMLPMMLQGAAAGGNGIVGTGTGGNPLTIEGGNLSFQNAGTVVTNGVNLPAVTLSITSSTGIDASKNSSFSVTVNATPGGDEGGAISLSAPYITTASTGLALSANGGGLSGGSITVSTSVTPIIVGPQGASTTNGAISFDVGDMEMNTTGNYVAGTVSITSPGALVVNGAGITYQDATNSGGGPITNAGIGGVLTLTSEAGSNLTLNNASSIIGLNFSTINFNSGSTGAFALAGASATGNGIAGTSVLTAGAVVVNATAGTINASGEVLNTHALTLNAPSITFGASQTITVQPDNDSVGITGPIGTTAPTGDGGSITINAPAFVFGASGGVTLNAPGAGTAALSASSTGGSITITDSGTSPLAINAKTFAGFNVSNAIGTSGSTAGSLQTAGSVSITNTGNISILAASPTVSYTNGSIFTYGNTGGSLTVMAPNISVTNVVALSQASQNQTVNGLGGLGLASITFTTNSATPFSVGGAATTNGGNGFTDASPILIAGALTIINTYATATGSTLGGINMTAGTGVQPNSLTLTTPGVVTFAQGATYVATQAVATNAAPTDAGFGGSITVTAGALAFSGTSANPTTFNAIGSSASGAGGIITFAVSNTVPLNIGNGQGDLAFNVSNTNTSTTVGAGSVIISNGGNLNVDANALTFGPSVVGGSGTLDLTGTNLLISNISNLAISPLFSMSLTSSSASNFVFADATTNGFVGTGQNLAVNSLTVNVNNTPPPTTVPPTVSTLIGGIDTTGINTSGSFVSGTNAVTVSILSLNTLYTITLGQALGVAANATSGTGGSLTLVASAITTPITGTNLSAAGTAGGSGGQITVTDSGTAALTLGTVGTTMGLYFNVSGNGTLGALAGTVTVSNGGSINANGSAFTFGPPPLAPSNTGSGTLSLTGTNVLISNVAPLNTSPLASITLTSTSTSDFTFGGATVNGFADPSGTTLDAYALVVNANNSGTLGAGINAKGLTTPGVFTVAATNITLNTLNTVTFGSNGTLTTVQTQPGGTGGSITVSAGAIAYSDGIGNVALNAEGSGTSGAGGSVTLTVASTGGLTIGSGGLSINVSNTGVALGGTVSVTNGGAITADGNLINLGTNFAANSGPSLTLNANGVLSLNNAANVNVANMLLLNLSSDSLNAFVLGGANVGTNGIVDAGLSLAATTLNIANQGGAIELGTAAGLNSATLMTLAASSDIGSTVAPIILNGATSNTDVALTAGGSASLSITDTQATFISNATIIGALQITAAPATVGGPLGNLLVGISGTSVGNVSAQNVTINYNINETANTNVLTLGTIAAFDGSLQVTSNAQSIVASILAVITAYNGNITLENTDTAAGSNIIFSGGYMLPGSPPVLIPGATLTAVGPMANPSEGASEGNVTISMGAPPVPPVAGTAPAGVQVIVNGGGAIYFGANSISAPGTNSVNLQALGTNLTFSTGTFGASAISLGSYVTITADPPGSAGVNSQASVNALVTSTAAILQAGASVSMPGSGGALMGLGNGSSVSGSGGGSLVTPSSLVPSSSDVNSSIGQPAFNINSVLNTPSAFTSGSLTAAIENLNVETMPVTNSGIGSGVSSAFSGVTTGGAGDQNLNGNVTDNEVSSTGSNGAISLNSISTGSNSLNSTSGSGRANATAASAAAAAATRTLTGGVSNTTHRTMDRGPILLSPLKDEVVETPFGAVSVAAHSVALIISSDDGLAVYNLHDTHKNAVVIKNGTSTVSLIPGRSAVFTRSNKSFAEVNPARFVSYRGVASHDGGSIAKLYQADFDITSIVRGLPAVKHLLASGDAGTRKAMGSMLKTAAILSQLSQSSEPYALYLTPELTAYAASAQH